MDVKVARLAATGKGQVLWQRPVSILLLDAVEVLLLATDGVGIHEQSQGLARGVGRVLEPTPITVLVGDHELAVLLAPHLPQLVGLRAEEVEPRGIAGQHGGIATGIAQGLEHDPAAVRPAPAVVAAPPLAVHAFAHLAGGADVVGQQPAVGLGAVHPRLDVVGDPLDVLVVAGVQVGVGDEAGGVQVQRDIAGHHARVHALEDLGEYDVIGPVQLAERIGGVEAGNVFVGRQVV